MTTAARRTAESSRVCTGAEYTRVRIERIDDHTDPQAVLEQVTRYRFAAPLIAGARAWCDLGGPGAVALSDAVSASPPERTLLVRGAPGAVEAAASELQALRPETLVSGLVDRADFELLRERLRALAESGSRCVTALDAIRLASSLAPTVAGLTRLSAEDGWDVVLGLASAPAESAGRSAEPARWSEGAIEELRSLLPVDHVVGRQVRLAGSRVDVGAAGSRPGVELRASLPAVQDDAGVTHFLVAFGPRAGELRPVAAVADAGAAA